MAKSRSGAPAEERLAERGLRCEVERAGTGRGGSLSAREISRRGGDPVGLHTPRR